MVVEAGLALTINAVVHRANIGRVTELVAASPSRSAPGEWKWRMRNITAGRCSTARALMPTRAQVAQRDAGPRAGPRRVPRAAGDRRRGAGLLRALPKPCMGGWARRSLNVTPSGRALPCHAAETIPGLEFWSVREHRLADIWSIRPPSRPSAARTGCRNPAGPAPRRHMDFGGCRCQALAIAGDAAATDPACNCHRCTRGCWRWPRAIPRDDNATLSRPEKGNPRSLPLQLAERRRGVTRVVVVEQAASAPVRIGRSAAPLFPSASRRRSAGGHRGCTARDSAARRPAPPAKARPACPCPGTTSRGGQRCQPGQQGQPPFGAAIHHRARAAGKPGRRHTACRLLIEHRQVAIGVRRRGPRGQQQHAPAEVELVSSSTSSVGGMMRTRSMRRVAQRSRNERR